MFATLLSMGELGGGVTFPTTEQAVLAARFLETQSFCSEETDPGGQDNPELTFIGERCFR